MERLNEIQSKMYQEFMKQKGEKPYVFNNEEYGYGMSIEQIDIITVFPEDSTVCLRGEIYDEEDPEMYYEDGEEPPEEGYLPKPCVICFEEKLFAKFIDEYYKVVIETCKKHNENGIIVQIDKWNLGTGEIKIYSRRDKKDIFVPIFYAVEYRFDNMDEN